MKNFNISLFFFLKLGMRAKRAAKYAIVRLNDSYRHFQENHRLYFCFIYSMNMNMINMKFRPIKTQK